MLTDETVWLQDTQPERAIIADHANLTDPSSSLRPVTSGSGRHSLRPRGEDRRWCTLTLLDASNTQHKIRLSGIDAPGSGQPFGTVSRDNLGKLVFSKLVTVDYDKRDRYGRIVGEVLIANEDANLMQIESGLAWHYKEYQHEQSTLDRQLYSLTESQARREHIGLWSDPDPVPPWEWRKRGSTGSCARSCSQLGSCDAAMRHMRECGGGGIDGDGDGIPCETLCR